MKSFFKKICQAFQDNEALFTDAGLPAVKTIDKYRGQPLNPQQFELFELPAVFVGWSISWQKKGKFYEGLATLQFHVMQDATWEISNVATNQEEGLKQVVFIETLRLILDELESENTSKMTRADDLQADADVAIYDILTYTCNYYSPVAPGRNMVETNGDKLNIHKSIKQ